MSKLDHIPHARDYVSSHFRNGDNGRLTREVQIERMKNAALVFIEEIVDICQAAIEHKKFTLSMTQKMFKEQTGGVPRDVLLYGHRAAQTSDWTERTEIRELKEMPFVTAQKLIYKEKGWYLYEISDPQYHYGNKAPRNNIVWRLSPTLPSDEYFNKKGKCWHNNNLFPLDDE